MADEEAKQEVLRRQAAIREALGRRDEDAARSLMAELAALQLRTGTVDRAVKSLCNMASQAGKQGLLVLQEAWAAEAVRLTPGDAWAWRQHGKALCDLGRHGEALAAYDQAAARDDNPVSRNGRAYVLKAMGRLEEALAGYESTLLLDPLNVVAEHGRADVLRVMGRLEEALAAHERALLRNPGDAFARAGRAQVLKAMGRTGAALAAREDAARRHAGDATARCARAEALRSLGRLEDALAAYDGALRQHPGNVAAKTGRAEVLKAMGRLDEALVAYEEAVCQHPGNAYARVGHAEVLKGMGRLDEALAAYERAAKDHPRDVFVMRGRAEVLRALGRFGEALGAYEDALRHHPGDRSVVHGRACVLALLGRSGEALEVLSRRDAEPEHAWVGQTLRALILLHVGRTADALRLLDEIPRRRPAVVRKPRFQVALAALHLRQGRHAAAAERLARVNLARPSAAAHLLRIHAHGALADFARAAAIHRTVAPVMPKVVADILEELRRRHAGGEAPIHDEEWLVRREIEALLMLG